MKNYIQYHNTDKNGGRPLRDADRFAIYASKSIRHLQGKRVWLISGESDSKKLSVIKIAKKIFYLECAFVVDDVEEGKPSVASGLVGIHIDPPICLSGMPWFEEFKQRQQNFSLGVREIDPEALLKLEQLVENNSGRGATTLEENVAAMEIDNDPQCQGLEETERTALIQARIGQGNYRRMLVNIWNGRCAVTGCSIQTVLIASHAKPWRVCANAERLDPFNGLLLAASVDRLFDKGLIAFEDNGQVIVSGDLSDAELKIVGLSRLSRLEHLHRRHLPYLRTHRETVYYQK